MANNTAAIKSPSKLASFAKNNQIGMALLISACLYILNVIINPGSFNVNAFGSIFALTSMLALAAAGQTLVMITGGIDMSVGAVMSIAGLFVITFQVGKDENLLSAVVVALIVGSIIGLVNGFGVVKIGLPPMIVTMCVANVVTRLQYVVTSGTPNGSTGELFSKSVTTRLLGVFPTILFYCAVVFAIMFYLLNRSRYGQQLFLSGNNDSAAYLTGVKTKKVKILAYTLSGALSAVAGIIGAADKRFLKCQSFDDFTMQSIVAVVIGGTLLAGGKGSYSGSIAGALLLIVLSNFLAVLNFSQSIRDIIMGIVLIVLLTAYNRSKPIRQ
ncbi:ABC transporter permease [Hydrogenoanaerobacterium sp.]|uniref:ABC transporter permease n=1 Tax=Hydrogenoanaerobacterium sp. TaxID=2953763 RepID=UPI0028988A87|nr:ABC transporter permease [Hydrogenoanaerobacterium sp.]